MVKQRQNQKFIEKRCDGVGNVLCLVPICNEPAELFKNGRHKNYCNKHTFRDMQEFTNWGVLRNKVFKRDENICKHCKKKKDTTNGLIADHIIAIALGGDEWDINNIQTLCYDCNKIKTAEDSKKIAELRRTEKKQLGNTQLNLEGKFFSSQP